MLKENTLSFLENKKNLLAFSGGGDSTALFFLLLKNNIKFDIAIVNYGLRQQSKEEVAYAQELANKYNLKCHLHLAPKITQNFEANARKIRYDFFEELISKNSYENLLTAHHLGDRFEWMLMQFCKGAGCVELSGMQTLEQRDNYTLLRPLLHVEKSELLEYLRVESIKYYEDETNSDEEIKRNSFRHKYSQPLLKDNLAGIKKSFEYLDSDRNLLVQDIQALHVEQFYYFVNAQNTRTNIYTIDKSLKSLGYMLSANERELLKENVTLVVGRKYVINQNKNYIFITPFLKDIVMDKEFKEQMRSLHVEPKLRAYFHENIKSFEVLKELLSSI